MSIKLQEPALHCTLHVNPLGQNAQGALAAEEAAETDDAEAGTEAADETGTIDETDETEEDEAEEASHAASSHRSARAPQTPSTHCTSTHLWHQLFHVRLEQTGLHSITSMQSSEVMHPPACASSEVRGRCGPGAQAKNRGKRMPLCGRKDAGSCCGAEPKSQAKSLPSQPPASRCGSKPMGAPPGRA